MPVSPATRTLSVSPAELFQENLAHYTEREAYFAGRHRLVALVRLLVFGGAAVGAWLLFSNGQVMAGFGLLFAAYLVFLGLVRWHTTVGYQREHHRLLAQLNRDEQLRLGGKLTSFDPGLRYLDTQHPYAADLDVFGSHSLFQLLNRSTSRLGQDWLAGWLLAPSPAAAVRERQQATAELAPDVAWQQEWQARAWHYARQESDPRQFAAWLQLPDFFAGKSWLLPLLVVLPLLTVGGLVALLNDYGPWYLFGGLLLTTFLNSRFKEQRAAYYQQATAMRDALRAAHDQLALFEQRDWQDAGLRRLHRTLQVAEGVTASQLLGWLARIAGWFSLRQNPAVAGTVNGLLLWDLWGMWQLERWKRRLGGKLEPLLEAAAELDALVSLAAFRAANPTYAEPGLSPEALEVSAEALGHPLIFDHQRITNDFRLSGLGQTAVITGSNMAGKSTFLRTVGLNMVLAQAGAVVAAHSFRCSPAQVYTAMRTNDNLAENTSSFYAELKRLRLLLDLAEAPEAAQLPVFYLLDEILKGTNSQDRHRGARALVHQLHKRPASGLISTHDLELAALEQELPGTVSNFSFNSFLEPDGTLRFDYHLTPGVCRAFNASQLMRLMGIMLE
ncbi:DNA mismatch repair protein MutS [Hymenobacter taeanensis]|uniref:DNA mismatch repair protein MutS n=1 Tax=Hymenobacter taeanensis TaxID=2735321 RepID=A0A6M6BFR5_9BACT|nr:MULTISPECIES: DNA mismatch repair protein MutS [Hymenobacter]QJX46083.1 DNA mismatch repair protein MutS [Hymenobacter taeanensis]UOQ79937.1 DNA mismatch repair protein MutS [Hymenobacter sp. 5414T-23]